MTQPKIALLGAGNIGGTLAHLALLKRLGSVVLFDIVPGLAQGKALDLCQSMGLEGGSASLVGTDCISDISCADVVIVTAGFPRAPGMSRDDLLEKNASVIKSLGYEIKEHAPQAFVIVVTNPLDAMVWVMKEATGFPPERVVGMAGILDSARFRSFLSEALGIAVCDIESMVLGGHGDLMVPLPRYTTISGIPLTEFVERGALSAERLEAIVDRTRKGGGEIVALLKAGSAFYTPASAALLMAESYLYDKKRLLPCAAWLDGPYGVNQVYAGVPITIGRGGVEKIWQLNLTEAELSLFHASIEGVKELIQQLKGK
jgi:malate dehydrogenase